VFVPGQQQAQVGVDRGTRGGPERDAQRGQAGIGDRPQRGW
jgi:hypothetical protein